MRKVVVKIRGKTPLLMHRFPMEPVESIEKKSAAEQAEIAAYRTVDGNFYIPGINLQRALVAGAVYSKGKGRGSLQKQVSASVFVEPDILELPNKSYEIDARPIVVPATKGRVIRYRPRFDKWECEFFLTWDENLLTEAQLRKVLDDTLDKVGLLDFRPEKKGMYGRAMVTHWAIVKD